MPENTYHDEPGRVRLPQEIADQWPATGYGDVHIDSFYDVLWWIADMGYSIVPDADYHEYLRLKQAES